MCVYVCLFVCVYKKQIDKGQSLSYAGLLYPYLSLYLFLVQSLKTWKKCIGLDTGMGLAKVQH